MRRVLIVIISILLLVSCSERSTEEGNINIAVSQEPVTLDIAVSSTLMGRIIASGNIYEKLLVLDGDGEIREELASSYYFSDDNRTLTFRLREGVMFHDGTVMRAEDAAASMNRYLSLYSRASELVGESRFEVAGNLEIKITGDHSLVFLPLLIASSPQEAIIMPSYLINGTDTVKQYIGTGPYKLSLWRSGEKIVLEKFDSYSEYGEVSNGKWGRKSARNTSLNFYFVPDSITRLLGLESGQYDFINDVMSSDLGRLESNEKVRLIEGDESGSIAIVFNKKEGPFKDKTIRQAVSLSLSSEELMAACYGNTGYSLSSDYMEECQKNWLSGITNVYAFYDAEKAQELLSGTEKVKLRILTSNLSNLDKIAIALKEELGDIGVECEIITLDWAGFIEKRNDPSLWDIYISAFTTVPLPQMKSYFSPSFPGWMEEESEAYSIIRKMNEAESLEEAEEIWKDGQEILFDYAPVYIPGHYSTVYASSSDLDNIIIQNGFFFWQCEKK